MADDEFTPSTETPGEPPAAPAADRPADPVPGDDTPAPARKTAAKRTATKKTAAKKTAAKKAPAKKATTKKAAVPPPAGDADEPMLDVVAGPSETAEPETATRPARKTAKKAATRTGTKKTAAAPTTDPVSEADEAQTPAGTMLLFQAPEPTAAPRSRRAAKTTPAATPDAPTDDEGGAGEKAERPAAKKSTAKRAATKKAAAKKTAAKKTVAKKTAAKKADASADSTEVVEADEADEAAEIMAGEAPAPVADEQAADAAGGDETDESAGETEAAESAEGEGGEGGTRRRRRRGGRRRRKSAGDDTGDDTEAAGASGPAEGDDTDGETVADGSTRRRRKRRREGDDRGNGDDPDNTVTRVRKPRSAEDEITAVSGSTRLEAKKQRRREGREAGRRRAPIVSEAEFLARRESVDRVMVIRQRDDLTQIGVLEDKVLVEHYVARESQTSLIGNVYLGRVQNVLPSMEAAFIDIGKGRNAVLYAGEVNWSALGHKDGAPRKIESVLSSGQTVLVQVTKDPVGHKGARLTSQVSLAGRFLVYVPDGTTSGISRKLPDTERNRLKTLLKEIVPDSAGVIVRTAAEGASEDELTRDVERLKARWEDIEAKSKGGAPKLLYGEPDLTLKVVRDLFTEDFAKLVIQGDDAWETVAGYVGQIAPDLEARMERYESPTGVDIFTAYRVDEQIAKALDRKVWLPSGGSLIIDRTEAMTVVDVNTGKFTGSGGNLEETVTKNNLEAAEEVVRQLRLRDIGGIIVVDFIDMVLESNRDLVLRRLVECLGRDRTRHQVAEVTSLGLVQMTRKRIGTGLLEAFSENCPHCQGRGLVVHDMPVEAAKADDDQRRGRRRGGRGRGQDDVAPVLPKPAPTPKDIAAMAKPPQPTEEVEEGDADVADVPADVPAGPLEEAPATAPAALPVEEAAEPEVSASEPEQEPERAAEPQPEPEPEPEPEPGPEPVDTTPKVVTRTRRSASRPAGTPVTTTSVPPAPIEVPIAVATDGAGPAGPHAPVEPPKVVTRTRGRAASRPAGPPEAMTADADEAEAPSVEHVPIKKKGTRKR